VIKVIKDFKVITDLRVTKVIKVIKVFKVSKGDTGNDGVGIPAGGVDGQALIKSGGTDYSVTWGDAIGSGTKKYLAYVTFTAAEAINTITMVDPNR
jgi:hypothetical protein